MSLSQVSGDGVEKEEENWKSDTIGAFYISLLAPGGSVVTCNLQFWTICVCVCVSG
jgi:hypothetical protein